MGARLLGRPLLAAAVVFLIVGSVAAALVWHLARQQMKETKALALNVADEHAQDLRRDIEHNLSALYPLAALVRQGQGKFENFDEFVEHLVPLYPALTELALAPDGIIRKVAPLAGNEKAIGFDLLRDPVQRAEALRARDSGHMTLAGPLELVQGGKAVVGRLPIILRNDRGQPYFWGFGIGVMRFPQIIEAVNLSRLHQQGYGYELWRLGPDGEEEQVIAASGADVLNAPVAWPVQLPNSTWRLSIAPRGGWINLWELALESGLGLLVSFFAAYATMVFLELRLHKRDLQGLVEKRTADLRAREARYRELFEANPQPMWVYDMQNLQFLAVNDAAVAHYGYTREEFLAMRITDIRPAEDVERLMQRIAAVRKEDVRDAGIWRHRKKDGSLIDVEVKAHTLAFGGRNAQIVHINDITPRLRAEQELKISEDKFRKAFAANPDAINITRMEDGRYVSVNRGFAEAMGYAEHEVIGRTSLELNVWSDAQDRVDMVRALKERGQVSDFEVCFRAKDGTLRDGLMYAAIIEIDAEPHIITITKDITQRKQVEQALQQSEARFRSLTEMSSDFYWESDAEHRITRRGLDTRAEISQVFLRGTRIGERRWEVPYLSPDAAGWEAHKRMLDAHLPFRNFELSRAGPDGTERYVSISGDPVFDASGIFIGYHGVGTDITERKRDEKLLRLEHAVARSLAGASDEITAAKTVMRSICETNNWGRGTYWRVDETAGLMRFCEAWNPPDEQFALYTERSRGATFARGVGIAGRVWESGQSIWVANFYDDPRVVQKVLARELGMRSMFIFPILGAGTVMGALAFFSRTERAPDDRLMASVRVIGVQVGQFLQRLRAEDAVRTLNAELEGRIATRTQELEIANHELEAFSYSVSHDLRAPLRAIHGFSSLLQEQYADRIDAQGQEMLGHVSAGAQRMSLLIDDLLKLSRISHQEMRVEPVDLSEMAWEVIGELQAGAPERRVEWVIAPGVSASGDPGLLRVVMQNVIGNAWKYSSKREHARVEFGLADHGGSPAYFVRDNGAGFDMSQAKRLFGAFQRLHSSAEFPGSGIGLATVARILQRHDGRAWAEAQRGAGATFYFSLGNMQQQGWDI